METFSRHSELVCFFEVWNEPSTTVPVYTVVRTLRSVRGGDCVWSVDRRSTDATLILPFTIQS